MYFFVFDFFLFLAILALFRCERERRSEVGRGGRRRRRSNSGHRARENSKDGRSESSLVDSALVTLVCVRVYECERADERVELAARLVRIAS